MRLLIALFIAAVAVSTTMPLLAPAAAPADGSSADKKSGDEASTKPTARVILATKDYLQGTDFALTDEAVAITTSYSGAVAINRKVVAGVTFGLGHDEEILASSAERDVVYLKSGDKVSGDIVKSGDGTLLVKTFYGGGRESEIALDKVDYITFHAPAESEAPELKPDPVRVIFDNADVVSGTLVSFKNGVFRLETQYAGTLDFTTDDIQSLHNAKKSHQFFPSGLADAVIYLFDNVGDAQNQYRNMLIGLTQGLLGAGDTEGALKLLQKIGKYDIDTWPYEQLGRAFENAKMPDAAMLCYERIYAQRKRGIHLYRQVFQGYLRLERYAKAAEVYEELLKESPAERANYGFQDAEIRMALADVYDKTEEYEKAIGHLRALLDDSATDSATRQRARTALVEDFKKIGRLDELVAKYEGEATALDEQLGKDYLALVQRYVDADKLAKAKVQYERLVALKLDTYAAQAKALIDKAQAERGWSNDSGDDENGDDE